MVNETAKEGFHRLAFGGIHDAVRLLFCEEVNPRTLKNMDLFAVSEIRRPKNGGMEIRFFDRIEALRLLSELEASGSGAQALLSAIESGAAALVVVLALRSNDQTTSQVLVEQTAIPIEQTLAQEDTVATVVFMRTATVIWCP